MMATMTMVIAVIGLPYHISVILMCYQGNTAIFSQTQTRTPALTRPLWLVSHTVRMWEKRREAQGLRGPSSAVRLRMPDLGEQQQWQQQHQSKNRPGSHL